MAYPKFHGITLAANSVIENLHIERLSADPVPVTAGRVWYNSTDKVLRYSTLNGSGAVIVRTFASLEDLNVDIADLTADLAAEIARATAAEQTLTTNLAAEVARATAAEVANLAEAKTYTDTAITNLVNGAPAVLDTLQELATALENNPDIVSVLRQEVIDGLAAAKDELKGTVSAAMDTLGEIEVAINNEIADRAAAVAAETAARVAADDALDTRVSTMEGQVNGKIGDLTTLHTDAKDTVVAAVNEVQDEITAEVSARIAAVATEKTRAEAAEAQLTTDLAAEVTRATAAEQTLTTNLAAEVTRAQAAEAQLTTDLAAEVTRAQAAEATLTTNLAAEVTRAQAAEATLTTNLAAEVTRAQAAEATLTTDLAAEVTRATAAEAAEQTARQAGDQAIRDDVNAGKFTYTASAAALIHTVSHGLNTDMFVMNVMVEGSDGVYRNDVVPVEIVDANSIKIELSESRKVKVSIISMDAI